MQEKQYSFSLEFSVRDYECDLQGVVNNANYQHYLEHARHEFLLHHGISFSGLHNEGTDLFITHIEINYKSPLRSGDKFVVKLYPEMEGHLRLIFVQEILRLPDLKTVAKARVTGVAIRNGRPVRPTQLLEKLDLTS